MCSQILRSVWAVAVAAMFAFPQHLVAQIEVREVKSLTPSLPTPPYRLLNWLDPSAFDQTQVFSVLNHSDPQNPVGPAGQFGGDLAFPGNTAGDDDYFAVRAVMGITIPSDGKYTFHVARDEWYELVIENKGNNAFVAQGGTGNTLHVVDLKAGTQNVCLLMSEQTGAAHVELSAAPGELFAFDGTFDLVGDTANGGLATTARREIYVTGTGFTVLDRRTDGIGDGASIDNLSEAYDLLDMPDGGKVGFSSQATGTFDFIDHYDPESPSLFDGRFGIQIDPSNPGAGYNPTRLGTPFPNDTPGNDDGFAIFASANLFVPVGSDGTWTFGISNDDGFELKIDGSSVMKDDPGLHLPLDNFKEFNLSQGNHTIELVYFEQFGHASIELFAAPGKYSPNSFNGAYELITVQNFVYGEPVPEPSTLALLAVAAIAAVWRLRRRTVRP